MDNLTMNEETQLRLWKECFEASRRW